jgi:hypothetical protein
MHQSDRRSGNETVKWISTFRMRSSAQKARTLLLIQLVKVVPLLVVSQSSELRKHDHDARAFSTQ